MPSVTVLPEPATAVATVPEPVIDNVCPPTLLVNTLISELFTVVVES